MVFGEGDGNKGKNVLSSSTIEIKMTKKYAKKYNFQIMLLTKLRYIIQESHTENEIKNINYVQK